MFPGIACFYILSGCRQQFAGIYFAGKIIKNTQMKFIIRKTCKFTIQALELI